MVLKKTRPFWRVMMVYELWDMVSLGEGESPMPFTLLDKSDNFENIYIKFNKTIKHKMCVIFVKTKDDNND